MVNNAQTQAEAEETLEHLQAAVQRFLGRELQVLGMVPADPSLLQSVREQRGVVERFPRSPSALAFRALADQLKKKVPLQKDGFASFWKQLRSGEP